MELYDVVTKLVGPIRPVGETNEDERRFENLRNMADLVDKLLTDIDAVIPCKDRHEHSMRTAGEFANKFFDQIGIVN